jgi:hypothetical protein
MYAMIESPACDRITAYAVANRINMAIEAIELQEDMAGEANNNSNIELACFKYW